MAKIKATKAGRIKEFTELQWANMPENKYGWSQVGGEEVEAPAEVRKIAEEPKKVSIATPPEAVKSVEKVTVDKAANTPKSKGRKSSK